MDQHQLRSIILRLDARLSDDDRQRFHFFMGNDVPRRIRDDATLRGTLALVENLFDQDKINERDFNFLIEAFEEIECIDAAKLLREYRQQLQCAGTNHSIQSLAVIMPSIPKRLHDIVQDQEMENESNDDIIIHNNFNYGKTNYTNDDRAGTILLKQKKNNRRNALLWISTCLSLLAVGVLTCLFIWKFKQESQLRKELTDSNRNYRTVQMTGKHFGGYGGNNFDDSYSQYFTCSHYISGIESVANGEPLEYLRFFYSSSNSMENETESLTHGKQRSTEKVHNFQLDKTERFNKVQIYADDQTYPVTEDTSNTAYVITGIQFFTTNNRSSPFYGKKSHKEFIETFESYTLGYVFGGHGYYIDWLQFVWYRTRSRTH